MFTGKYWLGHLNGYSWEGMGPTESNNISNWDREINKITKIRYIHIYLFKEAKLISIKYKKIFISTEKLKFTKLFWIYKTKNLHIQIYIHDINPVLRFACWRPSKGTRTNTQNVVIFNTDCLRYDFWYYNNIAGY